MKISIKTTSREFGIVFDTIDIASSPDIAVSVSYPMFNRIRLISFLCAFEMSMKRMEERNDDIISLSTYILS